MNGLNTFSGTGLSPAFSNSTLANATASMALASLRNGMFTRRDEGQCHAACGANQRLAQ
jgi:hypothetical protein